MARASSIDQLPDLIRSEIGRLRMQGATLDQILEHLQQLTPKAPSRSALHRHVQGMERIGEKMRRSRDVATALVRELGDAPESTAARINIELMHTAVLDLFMKAADGADVHAAGSDALNGDPEGVMMLAKALDHLARASKTNIDFVAAAELRAAVKAKKEAAVAVESVARERGISGDTIEAIKRGIFGV